MNNTQNVQTTSISMDKDIQVMIDSIGETMANAIFERMNSALQSKINNVSNKGDQKQAEKKCEITEPVNAPTRKKRKQAEQVAEPADVHKGNNSNELGNDSQIIVPELLDVVSGRYVMFTGYISKNRTCASFLFDEKKKAIKILKNSEIPVDCDIKHFDEHTKAMYVKVRNICTLTLCSRYRALVSQERYEECKKIIENGGIPGVKYDDGVHVNEKAAPVYKLNQDSEWIDYSYGVRILFGDNVPKMSYWQNPFTCETFGSYMTRKGFRTGRERLNGRNGEIVVVSGKEGDKLNFKLKSEGEIKGGYLYTPSESQMQALKEIGID